MLCRSRVFSQTFCSLCLVSYLNLELPFSNIVGSFFAIICSQVEFSVSLQLNFSFKPPKDAVSVVTVCPFFS